MALEKLKEVPEFKLKKLEGAKKLFKIEKVERVKVQEPLAIQGEDNTLFSYGMQHMDQSN